MRRTIAAAQQQLYFRPPGKIQDSLARCHPTLQFPYWKEKEREREREKEEEKKAEQSGDDDDDEKKSCKYEEATIPDDLLEHKVLAKGKL